MSCEKLSARQLWVAALTGGLSAGAAAAGRADWRWLLLSTALGAALGWLLLWRIGRRSLHPALRALYGAWAAVMLANVLGRTAERVQQAGRINPAAGQFGALLRREIKEAEPAISFSKHAQSRAAERGIQVDDTLMGQLADSVERAQAKGATNILAFDATRAFIINVPHGRVITTMSQEEMEENIFTNIDGAVLLK